MLNEKAQVDLLSRGDIIVLRAMDMFSNYSLLLSVQPKKSSKGPGCFPQRLVRHFWSTQGHPDGREGRMEE